MYRYRTSPPSNVYSLVRLLVHVRIKLLLLQWKCKDNFSIYQCQPLILWAFSLDFIPVVQSVTTKRSKFFVYLVKDYKIFEYLLLWFYPDVWRKLWGIPVVLMCLKGHMKAFCLSKKYRTAVTNSTMSCYMIPNFIPIILSSTIQENLKSYLKFIQIFSKHNLFNVWISVI